MQPKLTIGDRVITTRNDGEIGTVRGIMISGTGYYTALISFDKGENKWIGVAYLARTGYLIAPSLQSGVEKRHERI